MTAFVTMHLAATRSAEAPDGSALRALCRVAGGGMAHFELAAGRTSRAVTHRTVEEIWYVVHGRGEMWRRQDEREEVVALEPGVCLTVPVGTHFQFRAADAAPLAIVGVTLPPWPGEEEAVAVRGPWRASDPATR